VKYVFQKKSLDKVNLKKLLIAAIQAAENGGKEVIKVYLNGNLNEKSKGKTLEGANDPVTDADMKSHCAMYYSLVDQFPNIHVRMVFSTSVLYFYCRIKYNSGRQIYR
jgi:Inositol monophosphatase family.